MAPQRVHTRWSEMRAHPRAEGIQLPSLTDGALHPVTLD